MASNPRVLELLEEILDSGKTTEAVCQDCPELLPEVQKRLRQFLRVDAEVQAWYPERGAKPAPSHKGELPRIAGYEVQAELGRGGMGVVYYAWHQRLNRPVALKMLISGP